MVINSIKNIESIIKNPQTTSDKDLDYLYDLSLKHPYSGITQLLVAKILHVQNRTGYAEQLKKAAFTCTNRSVIYNYIHKEKLISTIEKVNTESDIEKGQSKEKGVDLLEQNIINSVINSSIHHEIEEYDLINDGLENLAINKPESSLFDENSTMTFSNWISLNIEQNSTNKKQIEDIDQLLERLSERNKKRNSKNSDEFFSPSKAAKLSLIDNDELVTETLAEIHIKQGNYPKAIKIYHQLMLKNPEKKAFFAGRINYINSKTNL
jgi:tetratricopeptide (TPR) repeat protein